MIQQTSVQSYIDMRENFEAQSVAVLRQYVSSGHPLCDRDVAGALTMPCSQVSARRNGLIDRGYKFKETRAKNTVTNRTVIYWELR